MVHQKVIFISQKKMKIKFYKHRNLDKVLQAYEL